MSPPLESVAPAANRVVDVRTPFGRPVAWAEVATVTDIGDSHELNDDRCLVLTSRDLSGRTSGPDSEFMLCLLADGATGSTFAARDAHESTQAGWRASQLAQAAFVERFLGSSEIDILDQLKDGLRAADRALVESNEGSLSTTLTALYLSADGTAYAASIGDSVLLVLPPSRRTPGDRRIKKLGYEDTTAVGSGDTTLSYVDESELIEQWWPNKEGGPADMRAKPGTYFVLLSDGISDNLPIEFIDHLLHRHTLDGAAVGLPRHTRERRALMQKSGGGSTSELGLDNMSAIVVRFEGPRPAVGGLTPRLEDARLFSLFGTRGGPRPASGGNFGMVCLAGQQHGSTLVPGFLRNWLESEEQASLPERLNSAYARSIPGQEQTRFAALARDEAGRTNAFSSGLPDLSTLFDVSIGERVVDAARDSPLQRFVYSPRLWASTLAALSLFLLVSTAFATGTVRPAPPPVPTVLPGEPTPTPDLRPRLSLGGLLLEAPEPAATPTPVPAAPEVLGVRAESEPAEDESANDSAQPPSAPGCSNPLGLLCGSPPPPPPPAAPRRNQPVRAPAPAAPPCNNLFGVGCPASGDAPPSPESPVVPVASPGARLPRADPSAGGGMDEALQVASIADQRFERGLTLHAVPQPTPAPASP
jgi:serine/threonine protein phosphatase PrpC